MQWNNSVRRDRKKTRAMIIRCSDETFAEVMRLIQANPDCFIVFSKTSTMKLTIREEGW